MPELCCLRQCFRLGCFRSRSLGSSRWNHHEFDEIRLGKYLLGEIAHILAGHAFNQPGLVSSLVETVFQSKPCLLRKVL